ncbi:MAG: CapA family protein, partial [Gemmatimonadaceae bacterium]
MLPIVAVSIAGLVYLAVARPAGAQSAGGQEARHNREAGVRVCVGGDVTLGTNLDTTWVTTPTRSRRGGRLGPPRPRPRGIVPLPDPDSLLAPLRPLLRDADVVLLNVEGAIGEGPAPPKCREGSTNCYAFRQPPRTAAALRRLAGDAPMVGNLANNHANDAGPEGLRATAEH